MRDEREPQDSLDRALSELYDLRVPDSFQQKWQSAIVREEKSDMGMRRNHKKMWLRTVLPAAAALVLVVGAVWVGGLSPEQKSATPDYAVNSAARSGKYAAGGSNGTALYSSIVNAAESTDASYDMAPAAGMAEPEAQSVAPEAADQRKLIRTADLTIRTSAYDADLAAVNALIQKVGGYAENIYADGSQNPGATRSAALTVRVPSQALDSFLSGLEGIGRIVNRSESVEDQTLQYADNEARLKTLREKMNRLNELLGRAESVADIIEIETSIADTQYAIDRFETTQRTIDRNVDMSRVYLNLQEDSPVAVTSEMSLGERISAALSASWKGLVRFLRNMLVFLVMALPAVGVVALVIVLVLVIRRAVKKNRKKKPDEPEE